MAAVAMHAKTFERVNLTSHVRDGGLVWDAPAGSWKVMLFTCVPDGARGLVDYLDPEAVKKFIALTYEKYYARFPEPVRHDHRQRLLRRADVPLGPGRPGLDARVQSLRSPAQLRLRSGSALSGAVVRHRSGDGRRAQRPVRLPRRAVRRRLRQDHQRLVPRATAST